MEAITDWMLIWPFANIVASGYEKLYPPESEFNSSETYTGKNGIPVRWFPIKVVKHNCWIDFRLYFSNYASVFYANNFVYSPQKQTVQIRIGTSGSVKTFLNDELVLYCLDENNNNLDTYIVETELQSGWNRLLVKCGSSEIKQCNFMLRITDVQGGAIDSLKFSKAEKPYLRHPQAAKKVIENFAERFFKQKIAENPDHLENYLLLADCYLRNDKAVEAELILREAIRRSPDCALFYHHILEAYQRAEKYDKIATTQEKIFELDQNVPQVLESKTGRCIENDELNQAEKYLTQLERYTPESAEVYKLSIELYARKEQIEKVVDTVSKAYQQYPDNWVFAYSKAILSIEQTRNYNAAIDIIKRYLANNHQQYVFQSLAEIYLLTAQFEEWKATWQRCLQFEPAASIYYYQMADVYIKRQDYSEARDLLTKALDICPTCTHYWSKLGEVHRMMNHSDLSKQAYREALKYLPFDYDARDVIRELEGKLPVFDCFTAFDIDSLIRNSPQKSAYPDEDAVILLDDAKRVVYEGGGSEFRGEILVKIFNNRGIDRFKEYGLGYNAYNQNLIVEKAVVIKSDRSEIEADVNTNHLVFKSLEENDLIYIKWKIKNFYNGKLARHFWDSFHFNCFYPTKIVRYSLLAKDKSFQFNTRNMLNEPIENVTSDGTLYKWVLFDEPAIKIEPIMPVNDVGKILYISSLPDWNYLVEWYSDLAQARSRSSYEIRECVSELLDNKNSLSEREKIKIMYDYVNENIRYSYIPFRQSGLIPQKARDVLVSSIGDCKDKCTLLISMLREIGIKAYYVLINTKDEGFNRNILPSIAFNHCMVAVETKDELLYLDPSAYNYPMGVLPELNIDGFSLLIKPGIKTPRYLKRENVNSSNIVRQSSVKLMADNSASISVSSLKTGIPSARMRDTYRDKCPDDRKKILAQTISQTYPNMTLNNFNLKGLDTLQHEVLYNYDFQVPDYMVNINKLKLLTIPWTDALQPVSSLSLAQRQHAYLYWDANDTLIQKIEIHLPANYKLVEPLQDVKLLSPVAEYSLNFTCSDGMISGRREFINKKRIVQPHEYLEFKKFYNNVIKQDSRQILLKSDDLFYSDIE